MTYWKVSFSRCHVGPGGVLQLLRSTIHPLTWWRLDLEPFKMGAYQYYIILLYLALALEHAAHPCQGGKKSASGSWRCGERCAVSVSRIVYAKMQDKIKKIKLLSLEFEDWFCRKEHLHAVFLIFQTQTLPLQVFLVWTGWTWGKIFPCRYPSMNHGTSWMKACLWDWTFSSCWGHKASHCQVF